MFKIKLVILATANIVQPVSDAHQIVVGLFKLLQFGSGEDACLIKTMEPLETEYKLGRCSCISNAT